MTSIWQHMYNGMGAGAWLCGLMFFLGVALLLIGLMCYAVLALLKSDNPDGEEAAGDGGAEDLDPYDIPGATAPVGRHVRKRA